jgi:hypothetical protein
MGNGSPAIAHGLFPIAPRIIPVVKQAANMGAHDSCRVTTIGARLFSIDQVDYLGTRWLFTKKWSISFALSSTKANAARMVDRKEQRQ